MIAYGLHDRSSITGKGRNFSLHHNIQTGFGDAQASCSVYVRIKGTGE
jgi:hypothetical protein